MENKIKGGKADGKTIEDIAKKHKVDVNVVKAQLNKGIKVEREHTNDDEKAKEIALDHLFEFPDYYTRLNKMEKEGENAIEAKESMGADASGSYEAPFMTNKTNETVILKKDIHNWKSKQSEVKEMTGADVSAGAMYDAPPKGLKSKDPLKIDNPGLPKTGSIVASKEGRAFKDKKFPKFGGPGAKFVDVKKQCTIGGLGGGKSKACNQGNQGNLNFYESKEVQDAIKEAAVKYGISIEKAKEIVLEGIENLFDKGNEKAFRSMDRANRIARGEKIDYDDDDPEFYITTKEPLNIRSHDESSMLKLRELLYKLSFDAKIDYGKVDDKPIEKL